MTRRKSSKHETGYSYIQTQLQNFFCSRRNFGDTINFGGTNVFVRLNFNRCAVKFFLFPVDGGTIRNGGKNESDAGKKNYACRHDITPFNGIRRVGGCRAHIDTAFRGVVDMFCCILRNCAWSFGLQ